MSEDRFNRIEDKLDRIAEDVAAIKQWKGDVGRVVTGVSATVSSVIALVLGYFHK